MKLLPFLILITLTTTTTHGGVMDTLRELFNKPSTSSSSSIGGPPKLRDMNRVPKPPKYPLYDLDSISLATPPPAPVMHPMSALPSENFQVIRPFRPELSPPSSSRQRERHRQQHQQTSNKRRPPPQSNHQITRRITQNHHHHHHHQKPKNHHRVRNENNVAARDKPHKTMTAPKQQREEYFSHPMASNVEPVKIAPALGRPLSYEEYMQRPSNSYVNDPWNFDPFAQQMNAGLITSGLQYNYDPLGTMQTSSSANSMAHLDTSKLSFPGDSFLKTQQYDTMHNSPPVNGYQQQSDFSPHKYEDQLQGGSENSHVSTIGGGSTQKIEFTIETSPDGGVNVQQVNPGGQFGDRLSDEYSPNGAPFSSSGYDSSSSSSSSNLTPSDMLPPPQTPTSFNSNNNNKLLSLGS